MPKRDQYTEATLRHIVASGDKGVHISDLAHPSAAGELLFNGAIQPDGARFIVTDKGRELAKDWRLLQ